MHRRPILLIISALLLLYFPMERGYHFYLHKNISFLDAILFGLIPIFLIAGLVKVTRVGWYTLIAMIALWGIQDLNVYYLSHGKNWSFFLHLGIYAFSLSYFINPRVKHLYFDPKLRWWRTKPRYETHLSLIVKQDNYWDYPLMRNISEGGCFLETKSVYSLDGKIDLSIPLPVPLKISVIQLEGEVRWVSLSESKPGMGIQFKNISNKNLSALKDFVRREL